MFMFLGFIPKNFLEKQTHKKTQKIQLKNEIINLKALIFNSAKSSNPQAISPESPKLESHQIPKATTHTSSITKLTLKPRTRPPHFLNSSNAPDAAMNAR